MTNEARFRAGDRVSVSVDPGEYMTDDEMALYGVSGAPREATVVCSARDGEGALYYTCEVEGGDHYDFREGEVYPLGGVIRDMRDLCECFLAEEPAMLNERIYDGTDCGASISVYLQRPGTDAFGREEAHHAVHNGMHEEWRQLTPDTPIHSFTVQTIVEGSDATVDSEPFVLPVPKGDVDRWMDYMEATARELWREANVDFEEEEL